MPPVVLFRATFARFVRQPGSPFTARAGGGVENMSCNGFAAFDTFLAGLRLVLIPALVGGMSASSALRWVMAIKISVYQKVNEGEAEKDSLMCLESKVDQNRGKWRVKMR